MPKDFQMVQIGNEMLCHSAEFTVFSFSGGVESLSVAVSVPSRKKKKHSKNAQAHREPTAESGGTDWTSKCVL